MRDLLATGPTRAGVFFLAAFLVASLGGVVMGDLRLGMTTGVGVGLLMAVFGYLFVRPADTGDAE
jgi:hypothetical protein